MATRRSESLIELEAAEHQLARRGTPRPRTSPHRAPGGTRPPSGRGGPPEEVEYGWRWWTAPRSGPERSPAKAESPAGGRRTPSGRLRAWAPSRSGRGAGAGPGDRAARRREAGGTASERIEVSPGRRGRRAHEVQAARAERERSTTRLLATR
ncbi:hypothetical protein HBB16_08850 [Pseudonocardia sp. MCCB 268]|nr:hypothetical protein [Pseudonocardia cytotoxica]